MVIENIFTILGLSCLAIIVAIEVKHPFDFKPFNCESCLSFWFALFYFINIGEKPLYLISFLTLIHYILMASITFIVTKVLAKIIYL